MNNLQINIQKETDRLPHLAESLNACVRWRYEDLTQLLAAQLEILQHTDLAANAQEKAIA